MRACATYSLLSETNGKETVTLVTGAKARGSLSSCQAVKVLLSKS